MEPNINITPTPQAPEPINPTFMDRAKLFYIENKWAVWTIAITLLITSIFIFFMFWSPNGPSSSEEVNLSITAPNEIASGSEIVYKIEFSNKEGVLVKDAVIDIVFPTGFTFKDSVPEPESLSGSRFTVASIEPGDSGTIMVKGQIFGNVNEERAISAVMRYRFANSSSEFVVQAQSQSKIVNSNVLLQFDGPFKTSNGQNVTYVLSYTNTTDEELNELKLNVGTPSNFKVISQDPKPDSGSLYNVKELESREKRQITIVGAFEGAKVGEDQVFSASIEGLDETGRSYTLSSTQYSVSIAQDPLTVEISGRNTTNNSDTIVYPGDIVDYRLRYHNNDSSAAHGVIITAKLVGDAFDITSIDAPNASFQNGLISWDASQVSQLGNLGANQGGEVSFRVRLKNPATRTGGENLTIAANAGIKSYEFEQPFISPNVVMKIATIPKFDTSVVYKSGAHPPIPDQSTTYTSTLSISNASNDIESAIVSFNLPNSTSFDANSVNAEEKENVVYDRNSRKITWNVGNIPAHAGVVGPARKLQFDVTIVPVPANMRKAMTLASNISFNAVDSFTKQSLSLNDIADITTIQDRSGQGVVGGF
jgi:hypothetical protein